MRTVPSQHSVKPVVVVGAGVAGLVSAHLLLEAGVPVVVVERQPEIGGLAKSFVYDGFVFDCGPHRFHVENPNVKRYLERVLADRATYFPRRSEVYFEGSYYNWPLHPKNLLQLPKDLAVRSLGDLAFGGLKKYTSDTFEDYVRFVSDVLGRYGASDVSVMLALVSLVRNCVEVLPPGSPRLAILDEAAVVALADAERAIPRTSDVERVRIAVTSLRRTIGVRQGSSAQAGRR